MGTRGARADGVIARTRRDVCLWHLADMATVFADVRFRGAHGARADVPEIGQNDANDPKRTSLHPKAPHLLVSGVLG